MGEGGSTSVSTEELFRRHAQFVARFLYRLGVGLDEIEDAVQEVFLVVHRNGGYVEGRAKPTSYLGSIALRAAASHRRRAKVRARRHQEEAVEELTGHAHHPGHLLEIQESLAALQLALDELPEPLRALLILVELEGESCGSVAASLNVPLGTVYWRLHQARKMFRQAAQRQAEPASFEHEGRS